MAAVVEVEDISFAPNREQKAENLTREKADNLMVLINNQAKETPKRLKEKDTKKQDQAFLPTPERKYDYVPKTIDEKKLTREELIAELKQQREMLDMANKELKNELKQTKKKMFRD